jgi:hypothetical protein
MERVTMQITFNTVHRFPHALELNFGIVVLVAVYNECSADKFVSCYLLFAFHLNFREWSILLRVDITFLMIPIINPAILK